MQDYMMEEGFPYPPVLSCPVPSRPVTHHFIPITRVERNQEHETRTKTNTLRVSLADRQGSQQSFISGKISKLFRSENDTLKIF